MNNELKDKILSKIAAESPDEWEFIINKLSKDCIEDVAASYNSWYLTDPLEELLDMVDPEPPEAWTFCKARLMGEASKKMWAAITKDNANQLLKSMYAVGATKITMPNGVTFSPSDIINCWKKVNEPEDSL